MSRSKPKVRYVMWVDTGEGPNQRRDFDTWMGLQAAIKKILDEGREKVCSIAKESLTCVCCGQPISF
jgi:L-lactate utilization protein LutB